MKAIYKTQDTQLHTKQIPALLPLAAIIASLSFGVAVHAQVTGNNVSLTGTNAIIGGQVNNSLIQSQATLKNIVVNDAKTTVTTSSTGSLLNGFDVNTVRSDAGSLVAMQNNGGRIVAVTEYVVGNNLPNKIDILQSETAATGNAAVFGSTDASKPSSSLSLQMQMNTGSVEATTNATNMSINTSAATREAVISTSAAGNSLAVINTSNVSGERQINMGAVSSTTDFSTTGPGTLTKLQATSVAVGTTLAHTNVGFVNLQNPGANQGVQDNGGSVTARTTVSNVTTDGTNETLIRAFANGTDMSNSKVAQIASVGTAPAILQNNSGNVSANINVNNVHTNGEKALNVVAIVNGNNLSNENIVLFQQGSSTSPNNNVMQQNSGIVSGRVALVNTSFSGDLNVVNYATGNNARVAWDNPTASTPTGSLAVLGSQINRGEVSAITTWTYDPSRNVTIDTRATGNNLTLSPTRASK